MSRPVDFLIFAPLREERQAILDELPGYSELPPEPDNVLVYHRASLAVTLSDGTAGEYSIAIVSPLGMGRVSAATAIHEALTRFSVRHVLLVGIAGGVAGRVAVGDVLISDQIVDYELQKYLPEGPEVRYSVFRADPVLLGAVQGRVGADWHEPLRRLRPEAGTPVLHIGPVASGDKVIAAGAVLGRYRAAWPKLIGVEMEGGGVASAVATRTQAPGLLMIRGVSDLADENKNRPDTEKWRAYACAVAARYAAALLRAGPVVFASKAPRSRPETTAPVAADPGSAPPGEPPLPEPRKQPTTATSRPGMRRLLHEIFPDSASLEAFCVGRFPKVARLLAPDMDLRCRVNLLLMRVESVTLLQFLRLDYQSAVDAHTQRLRDEEGSDAPGPLDYAEKSERLYQAREAALSRGEATDAIDVQIRELKREKRVQAPQLHEGDVLGERYRLCEEIGRGGFANVWQAWDRKLNLFVAVKVLHAQFRQQHPQWQRFARGAHNMARLGLKHPGFVKVLSEDLAVESGYYYFVMEYMTGGDLYKAVLGKWTPKLRRDRAWEALLSVGEALQFAHEQGLVHRDVKPQNILLDGEGHARLTDFDLVKTEDSTGNTHTGAMGTFIYAAPEELEDAKSVDRRADVYSLGMTCIFVLYEKPLPNHIVREPSRILESLDCAPAMREVLRRATAWDREDRFPTMAEFLAALKSTPLAAPSPAPIPARAERAVAPEPTPLAAPAPAPSPASAAPRGAPAAVAAAEPPRPEPVAPRPQSSPSIRLPEAQPPAPSPASLPDKPQVPAPRARSVQSLLRFRHAGWSVVIIVLAFLGSATVVMLLTLAGFKLLRGSGPP